MNIIEKYFIKEDIEIQTSSKRSKVSLNKGTFITFIKLSTKSECYYNSETLIVDIFDIQINISMKRLILKDSFNLKNLSVLKLYKFIFSLNKLSKAQLQLTLSDLNKFTKQKEEVFKSGKLELIKSIEKLIYSNFDSISESIDFNTFEREYVFLYKALEDNIKFTEIEDLISEIKHFNRKQKINLALN